MKDSIKRTALFLGVYLFASSMSMYVEEVVEYEETEEHIETTDLRIENTENGFSTVPDVKTIVHTKFYDEKEVYQAGLDAIAEISADIPAFFCWQEIELVDFYFLHSFETGYAAYALFDFVDSEGQGGHMIYDCEKQRAVSFGASASPYRLVDEAVEQNPSGTFSSAILNKDCGYYFYAPMSYGYGVFNAAGTMDIYNLRTIATGTELEVLRDVSFQPVEIEAQSDNQERTIVGTEEAITQYEAKRKNTTVKTNEARVLYPDYYLISGVPDYQQGTGFLCIPLSKLFRSASSQWIKIKCLYRPCV